MNDSTLYRVAVLNAPSSAKVPTQQASQNSHPGGSIEVDGRKV